MIIKKYERKLNTSLLVAKIIHLSALICKLLSITVCILIIRADETCRHKEIIIQGLWIMGLGAYIRYSIIFKSLITKNFVNYSVNLISILSLCIDHTEVLNFFISEYDTRVVTYCLLVIISLIEILEMVFISIYSKNNDFNFSSHYHQSTSDSIEFRAKIITQKLKIIYLLIANFGLKIIMTLSFILCINNNPLKLYLKKYTLINKRSLEGGVWLDILFWFISTVTLHLAIYKEKLVYRTLAGISLSIGTTIQLVKFFTTRNAVKIIGIKHKIIDILLILLYSTANYLSYLDYSYYSKKSSDKDTQNGSYSNRKL